MNELHIIPVVQNKKIYKWLSNLSVIAILLIMLLVS